MRLCGPMRPTSGPEAPIATPATTMAAVPAANATRPRKARYSRRSRPTGVKFAIRGGSARPAAPIADGHALVVARRTARAGRSGRPSVDLGVGALADRASGHRVQPVHDG